MAFDARELPEAERLFSVAIGEWRTLGRANELSALLIARANCRVDLKSFVLAQQDFDEARARLQG